MNSIRDGLHGKPPASQDQVQRPGRPLTAEDIAHLNDRREELNVILQQWHRYSRMQADRAISAWLYNHGDMSQQPIKNATRA
jgi:hypothetical protein